MDDVKDRCTQCGDRGPWLGIPNDAPTECYCDPTWFRRACGWTKSNKGVWYCTRCWTEGIGHLQTQAMESICVHCRKVVTEAGRVQAQRRQADVAGFYKIHQQQFQRQSVIDSMNRSRAMGPGLPQPQAVTPATPKASLETQQVKMINGKWQLVYKTLPSAQPAATESESMKAMRDALGITARQLKPKRSRSSSSSSSSSSRRERKKRKKQKKKRKKSSSSSNSRDSAPAVAAASGANAADAELNKLLGLHKSETTNEQRQRDAEVESAKNELLKQLIELKKVEPKDQRLREFRALLRAWHPDKNPNKVEVATLVFQFLQKSKQLLD